MKLKSKRAESDVPAEIKEAAGFDLSTLRSPTLFQTRDGHFFGWQVGADHYGSCHGNCTHVWNYEQASALNFAALARTGWTKCEMLEPVKIWHSNLSKKRNENSSSSRQRALFAMGRRPAVFLSRRHRLDDAGAS